MKCRIILIYIVILFNGVIGFSCNNNKKIILEEEAKGVIQSISQDRSNHNVYTFYIKSDEGDRSFIADFYPKSWEYASVGDSIIKNRGQSFLIIKKGDNSSKKFETRIR